MNDGALNAALAAIDEVEATQAHKAMARGLLHGYHARWAGVSWQTETVETEFHVPVVNPDSKRSSRSFTFAGKYDGIAVYEGKRYLVEHKTTSDDIADPSATYWRRLAIDAQISGYLLASWQEGQKLDGIMYDVIRKPGIRPRALQKKEVGEIASFHTYSGGTVSDETAELVRTRDLAGENDELFTLRLAQEVTSDPQRYYQRRTIPRLDADLLEHAYELWDAADLIRQAKATQRWPRNSGACLLYGRPCPYLGICSGYSSVASDKWARPASVHPELSVDDGKRGTTVLTNTSLGTFRMCPRKYQYRYELGLVNAEADDNLQFGSLFHAALAAWWTGLVPEGVSHV